VIFLIWEALSARPPQERCGPPNNLYLTYELTPIASAGWPERSCNSAKYSQPEINFSGHRFLMVVLSGAIGPAVSSCARRPAFRARDSPTCSQVRRRNIPRGDVFATSARFFSPSHACNVYQGTTFTLRSFSRGLRPRTVECSPAENVNARARIKGLVACKVL
jgi:hypothetical protein